MRTEKWRQLRASVSIAAMTVHRVYMLAVGISEPTAMLCIDGTESVEACCVAM